MSSVTSSPPVTIMELDHYGNPVGVGSVVAFNLSGEVRRGTVIKIIRRTHTNWESRAVYRYHIKRDKDDSSTPTTAISKVSLGSIMVLLSSKNENSKN